MLRKGDKCGRWEVIDPVPKDRLIVCQCECGTIKKMKVHQITESLTRMCRSCAKSLRGNYAINFAKDNEYPALDEEVSRKMQEDFIKQNGVKDVTRKYDEGS